MRDLILSPAFSHPPSIGSPSPLLVISDVQMPTRKSSLEGLRGQIKAGTDALERGDFIEVDDADLEGYLERLTRPAAKPAR